MVRPPQRPPKGVHSQTDVPRWPVGQDPPPCTRQALDPPGRSSDPRPRGQRWACRPDSLGAVSCLSPSLPRTPSRTLTRPAAAQVEIPCSPLHRLTGDLRSHRLPSLGNSSPVGREHPHRCPGCSAQAAAGSPSLQKSRSTCGAAPLNLHPEVCWRQLAEAPCPLSGGAWARRCSVQPCRGRQSLSLCQLRWGGPTFLAPLHSPRTAPAFRPLRSLSLAGSAAAPWGWNPHTPSSDRGRARRRSRPDASAPLGNHLRPADAVPPAVLRVPAEASPRLSWPADAVEGRVYFGVIQTLNS